MDLADLRFRVDQIAPDYARIGTVTRLWRLGGTISGIIRDDETGLQYSIRPRSALGLRERSRHEVEGKRCVFALGKANPNAQHATLAAWIIETSLEVEIGQYLQARRTAIQQWPTDQLIEVIEGTGLGYLPEDVELFEWADDVELLARVKKDLATPQDPLRHVRLWQAATDSPIRNIRQYVRDEGPKNTAMFNPHQTFLNSDRSRIRGMVKRYVELGLA